MAIELDNCDYRDKPCKCRVCKITRVCTFSFDFFPTEEVNKENGANYLMCERCMMREAFAPKKVKED